MSRILIHITVLISLLFFGSCGQDDDNTNGKHGRLVILYTNDEHGWMEATEESGGAAGMMGMWKSYEGYDAADASFLVLSGGDMWTGPAISTWFEGESMVEVMNAMGYDASALGNHEFDFSVEKLILRQSEMNFPLLSANIIDKSTGEIPSFVKPYVVINTGFIKVGIIGLASLSTPYSAFPKYVENYEFTEYGAAIEEYAPQAVADGAEMLIVIGHICSTEMTALASKAAQHGVSLIAGGHCHEKVLQEFAGVLMIESGAEMRNYVKVEYEINTVTKDIRLDSYYIIPNDGDEMDPHIQSIVADWKSQADEFLSEEIGYCEDKIWQSSVEMGNMMVDSWFYSFPDADITISNSGGIRQDIEPGNISVETIVSLLPFTNSIYELNLTGAQVKNCIDYFLIGGMTVTDGYKLMDGTPIHNDSTYVVLTTDYLYSQTNTNFAKYDDDPYETSVHYRQPLIDWIRSLQTSSQDPLNNYLDAESRR